MVILLFGPPGCGKGTQSQRITEVTGYPAISTGSLLRDASREVSRAAGRLRRILNSGGLVDDETVNRFLIDRITQEDCRTGFLLDGYPRTVQQARFFDRHLAQTRFGSPLVIHLDVAPETLVSRISARRECPACGRVYNLFHKQPRQAGVCDQDRTPLLARADDDISVVARRIREFQEMTDPVMAYYEGRNYIRLDGERTPDEIAFDIERVLVDRGLTIQQPLLIKRA